MISPLKVASNLIAKRATLLLGVSVPLRDFRGDKHFSKTYGWVCVNTPQRSLQTHRGNLTIVYSPNFPEISDYHLFFKLVRDTWLSPILQTCQRYLSPILQTCQKNLTTTYSTNLSEISDYHLFYKLVRDIWLSPILQTCQRYLTITYSPNFSEISD